MVTSRRTTTVPSYNPVLDTRSDHVCRWSAYGARAYAGVQRKHVHAPTRPYIDKRPRIWFGGNGLQAGFTVSNVESILSGNKYRKGTTGLTLRYYHDKLKNITILKACEILKRIGCADDTFHRVCDLRSKKYTRACPSSLLDIKGWYKDCCWLDAASTPATEVGPIEFLGGPPSRWGIQKGSLLTLLVDRVTVMILLGGSVADTDLRLSEYTTNTA